MLTKATGETDEGDVEDYEGHQALVSQQPHGPPDRGHRHGPRQGPQGPQGHTLSQIYHPSPSPPFPSPEFSHTFKSMLTGTG